MPQPLIKNTEQKSTGRRDYILRLLKERWGERASGQEEGLK